MEISDAEGCCAKMHFSRKGNVVIYIMVICNWQLLACQAWVYSHQFVSKSNECMQNAHESREMIEFVRPAAD